MCRVEIVGTVGWKGDLLLFALSYACLFGYRIEQY